MLISSGNTTLIFSNHVILIYLLKMNWNNEKFILKFQKVPHKHVHVHYLNLRYKMITLNPYPLNC